MDEAVIEDLKQFITATVSQATAHLATKEEIHHLATREDFDALRGEMHSGFNEVMSAIAETISSNNDDIDARLQNHESRLLKLEAPAIV